MALLLILAACALRPQTNHAEACRALGGDPVQAGALLQQCLDSAPKGGTLDLPPGRIVLALRENLWTAERPIVVRGAGSWKWTARS